MPESLESGPLTEAHWATPIYYREVPGWADHVSALKAALLLERAKHEHGRLDGSGHNVWDWAMPSTEWLKQGLSDAAGRYLRASGAEIEDVPSYWGRAWGNVLQMGHGYSYQSLHAHHEADFFAVFYVDAGDADAAGASGERDGELVLMDPRFLNDTHLLNRKSRVRIQPRTGWLLLAPGYVWHEVLPYSRSEPRVSIASNFQYSLMRIRE